MPRALPTEGSRSPEALGTGDRTRAEAGWWGRGEGRAAACLHPGVGVEWGAGVPFPRPSLQGGLQAGAGTGCHPPKGLGSAQNI